MKAYELTVLIHPDLEVDIDAPLAKVRSVVTTAGGTVTTEDNWGKKKLAYRLNNQDFAVYVYMEVALPPEAPLKISNTLNITEEVMRYLLVTVDDKGRKALEEQAIAAKNRTSTDEDERDDRNDRRRSRNNQDEE